MRKLVVSYSALTQDHRKTIRDKANGYGFDAIFCDDINDAKAEAADAEVVLGMSSEFATVSDSIKWICTPTAGVDHFLKPLEGKDTILSNSSGAYGVTIAEHIVMVTLELMRQRLTYRKLVADRIWRNDLPVSSVYGSRITFLGTGDIGRKAAVRLRAFNPANMTGVNRKGVNPDNVFDSIVKTADLDNILPKTDVLIMSLPSTAETIGIMSEERLELLPDSAYIVNVGRGNAIDQKAIERMLRDGRLAGAALDVFEKEPIPADDTLWDCPRLVLTTHVAGNWTLPYTVDTIVKMFLDDFDSYCNDRPMKNVIDRTAGY